MFKVFSIVLFFLFSGVRFYAQNDQEIEAVLKMSYGDIIADLDGNKKIFEDLLIELQSDNDIEREAILHEKLALVNYYLKDVESGLKHSLEAVNFYMSMGENRKAANIYADLGYAIKDIQLDRSIEYFRIAISMSKNEDFGADMGKFYNNYGTLMAMNDKLDSALFYHLLSLEVCYEYGDSLGMPYSMNNAAVVYSKLGDFSKAFEMLDQSDEIRLVQNNELNWADNLAYRADLYYEKGSYDSAVKYYSAALELSKKTKFVNLIAFSLGRLSDSYEKLNNAEMSLFYLKELHYHKDSILSLETNTAIAGLQEEFNAAIKEKKIAEQKLLIEKEEKKLIYVSILVVILMLSTALFVVYQLRKRKAERTRLEYDRAIEKERLEKEFLDEKLRIGRELHDNIGSQLTFIIGSVDNLSYAEKEEVKQSKLLRISDFGRQTMAELRTTIWAMKGDGGTLEDLILKINELKRNLQEVIHVSVENNVDSSIVLSSLVLLNFYRIVQEAIQNAVKYSGGTDFKIVFRTSGKNLEMELADNGKGFDVEKKKYTGNGLTNMLKRCEDCGGKFSIISSEKGTKITCETEVKISLNTKNGV